MDIKFICSCGCGGEIPYSPRHKYPSKRPKYIQGHNRTGKGVLNLGTLESEYKELKSGHKLAEKYGVSHVAVYNALGKLSVEKLPKEELLDHNQILGRRWELNCLDELEGALDFTKEDKNNPFDIMWKGLKIDVKTSMPTYAGNIRRNDVWSFRTRNKDENDFFLCIGLNESGELEKIFWIPSSVIKRQTTIRRNGNTKYEKYKTTFEELSRNFERQENNY